MPNVLVFPCGSEIGLEIHSALKYSKGIRLVGASSVADHGRFVYKNYDQISAMVGDPDFLHQLRTVIDRWEIQYIFPAFDTVIEALAKLSPDDLGGAEVVGSSPETNVITRYKSLTYRALDGADFVPRQFRAEEISAADLPLFLKPDSGYGSRNVSIVHELADLHRRLAADPELIAVELLPGREFTVDCFTDRHRQLLFVGPRVRDRIKSGISVDSTTIELTARIQSIAETINARLELRGQWFFQLKEAANGELKLLEVAPRVAGTMNLYRARGVNFPLLSLLDRQGLDLAIIDNGFAAQVDRALINRHRLGIEYSAVFVDFDDTITLRGTVNPKVMAFLYQARNAGKELILLTRHAEDLDSSLDRCAVSRALFTRIHHLGQDVAKSSLIDRPDAIFIDDSFRERRDVHERTGIPVFDVDAVEALLDWRL